MSYQYKLIILLVVLSSNVLAQNKPYSISGQTLDPDGQTIPFSTVILLSPDSVSVQQAALSDSLGVFRLNFNKSGDYLIKIQSIGYKTLIFPCGVEKGRRQTELGAVKMTNDTYALEEIEVTGVQNPNLYHVDKMVYRPDSLALIRSVSAKDVLRYVPNVHVSPKDHSIKVMGDKNALVLVDGRISDKDISTIHSSEIQSIEVITDPSAGYSSDIQSIVNIVLKKNSNNGVKIVTNLEQGLENELAFYNLSLDYKVKNLRVFTKYGMSTQNLSYSDSSLRKDSYQDEFVSYAYKPIGAQKFDFISHTVTVGTDYSFGKSNFISLYAKLNLQDVGSNEKDSLHTTINNVLQGTQYLANKAAYNLSNQNYYLYYNKKSRDLKHEFSSSSNFYLFNRDRDDIQYSGSTNDSWEESTSNKQYSNDTRIEYKYRLKNFNYEGGIHLYNRMLKNKYRTIDTIEYFDYQDNRNSIYSNFTYKHPDIQFQGGLRIESYSYKVDSKRNDLEFFPLFSFGSSIDIDKSQTLRLTYNRRLTYPSYKLLVPFEYYSADSLSLKTGNSNLRPTKTDKIELRYALDADVIECSINTAYYNYSDFISTSYALEQGVLNSQTRNINGISKYGTGISFSAYFSIFELYLDGNMFYWSFPDRAFNGYSHYLTTELAVNLPGDIHLGAICELFTKDRRYNGTSEDKSRLDFIYMNKPLLNNKAELSINWLNPFLRDQTYQKTYNNYFEQKSYSNWKDSVITIGFSYFFTKGKKEKSNSTPMHMEDYQEVRQ